MTKVLIVEDERIIAWNIQEVLKLTGHDVISSVATAEEAIALAGQLRPDLVLMDIRLSGNLDGIEAAEEIYASHGIPSIYLTAHADDCTVERAMETAPFGYVLKPFKRGDLLLAIKVAIRRHQQERKFMASHLNGSHRETSHSIPLANGTVADVTGYAEVEAAPIHPTVVNIAHDGKAHDEHLSLLAKFTTAIRESLDDKSIIQDIVNELGQNLGLLACHVALHPRPAPDTSILMAAFDRNNPDLTHFALTGDVGAAMLQQLSFHQSIHCCLNTAMDGRSHSPSAEAWVVAVVCPILNHHGTLIGDLLVMRPVDSPFTPAEISFLQYMADQCAIAIRQSHLYQTVQNYQNERGDRPSLTGLPSSWVTALSHELRTPISNIKMASQMLELVLKALGLLDDTTYPTHEYFQILQYECQREARLVEALVDANDTSSTQVLTFNPTELFALIQEVVNPCLWQFAKKNQPLIIDNANTPLVIKTVPFILKRVLGELLDYVCRNASPGHDIHISMKIIPSSQSHSHRGWDESGSYPSNSQGSNRPSETPMGNDRVELTIQYAAPHRPAAEINDLLKYSEDNDTRAFDLAGTSLGLFLAKQQLTKLNGQLLIQSHDGIVTFSLYLPDARLN